MLSEVSITKSEEIVLKKW